MLAPSEVSGCLGEFGERGGDPKLTRGFVAIS
jgi:hypothetical protein